MTDTNVFALVQPGTFTDRLTDVLRDGARALLARAAEAEVAGFLAEHADKRTMTAGNAWFGTATCLSGRS